MGRPAAVAPELGVTAHNISRPLTELDGLESPKNVLMVGATAGSTC